MCLQQMLFQLNGGETSLIPEMKEGGGRRSKSLQKQEPRQSGCLPDDYINAFKVDGENNNG